MTFYEFGAFRIYPQHRRLCLGDADVKIGGRTFDVLTALVERHGQIVSREELVRLAWPDSQVVESALRFQINAIRTALRAGGEQDHISSVAGRGYCFTAAVRVEEFETTSTSTPAAPFPEAVELIGRSRDGGRLIDAFENSRLVSIVGPGGMGKTSLAIAVARCMKDVLRNEINFVDLSTLADPLLVPSSIAVSLGLDTRSGNPLPGVVSRLGGPVRLLVMDNCEHVIEESAVIAARLLKELPNLRILATSREPLRVDGEHVYRLGPLAYPAAESEISSADTYDALDLFMARAKIEKADRQKPEVLEAASEICRALEGLPLAIEMAANRVSDLGLTTLANLLDHSLSILTKNRQNVSPRQQTMSNALDWSYVSLAASEAIVFRNLSAFDEPFTRDAAYAVAGGDLEANTFCTSLSNLIYKSLVTVDVDHSPELYRLPHLNRQYAAELLKGSQESSAVTLRHERYRLERNGQEACPSIDPGSDAPQSITFAVGARPPAFRPPFGSPSTEIR